MIVILTQGRPTRGPRAIFRPPGLLKWPAEAFLKENTYKSLMSKVVEPNFGPFGKKFGHPGLVVKADGS